MAQGSSTVISSSIRPECKSDYVVVIVPLGSSPLCLLTLKVILATLPIDHSVIYYYK